MAKQTKQSNTACRENSDRQLIEWVLRELEKAVPEIERCVQEREALAVEARFKPPRRTIVQPRIHD